MVAFLFVTGLTLDGLHWTYLAEILTDTQFGFVSAFHYFNGVMISLTSEYMFKHLRPYGTFLFYDIVTFIGFIFMIYYLKETNGLTDKQKK